jgi:magnesium-transporting ATPase (P-type)
MLVVFQQFLYSFFTGFSTTSCFDSGFISMFNTVLTTPQLFIAVIFEQDLNERSVLFFPEVYKETQKSGGLSSLDFFVWYGKAIYQSVLIFFYSCFEICQSILSSAAETMDYGIFTTVEGFIVLFVFTLELFFRFRVHSWIHVLLYALYIGLDFVILLIYSIYLPDLRYIVPLVFDLPKIWLAIPSCLGLIVVIELVYRFIQPHCFKSLIYSIYELDWYSTHQ